MYRQYECDYLYRVAIISKLSPLAPLLFNHPFSVAVRRLLLWLPSWCIPFPAPYGLVLELSREGTILRSFHDPDGKTIHGITAATRIGDNLYFGSLHSDSVGVLNLFEASV